MSSTAFSNTSRTCRHCCGSSGLLHAPPTLYSTSAPERHVGRANDALSFGPCSANFGMLSACACTDGFVAFESRLIGSSCRDSSKFA